MSICNKTLELTIILLILLGTLLLATLLGLSALLAARLALATRLGSSRRSRRGGAAVLVLLDLLGDDPDGALEALGLAAELRAGLGGVELENRKCIRMQVESNGVANHVLTSTGEVAFR